MTFGQLFKERREELNITQSQLAFECGYLTKAGPQFISNIGRGIAHPPPEALKIICEKFAWDYNVMAEMICNEKANTARKRYGLLCGS